MAYDKRLNDLMRRLDDAEAAKSVSTDEAKALEGGWVRWAEYRQSLLSGLVDLLEDSSKDKTDQEKAWLDRVDDALDQVNHDIVEVLSSVTSASDAAKA